MKRARAKEREKKREGGEVRRGSKEKEERRGARD